MEKVDILVPPTFKKSGKTKNLIQAWTDEDWIGTFNLWIVRDEPEPAVIYQQRSPESVWAPGKLDVTAGGHYEAGESIKDGLREVKEELGKSYNFNDLTFLGRKMHVSPDEEGRERRNIVDVFIVKDNSKLNSYVLQKEEVYAICACPLNKLIQAHRYKDHLFTVQGVRNDHRKIKIEVDKDSFPYNWDDYHYKIALLADRFLSGEKDLIY